MRPDPKGAITVATREKLDNLVFVINCNLQRLDGRSPVTAINELEGIFFRRRLAGAESDGGQPLGRAAAQRHQR